MKESGHPRRWRTILRWWAIVPFIAFATWRIVALNLSDYLSGRHDPVLAATALTLDPDHPAALQTLARDQFDSNPAAAASMLQRALPARPVHGMTYALLATALNRQGQTQRADQLAETAARLAPAEVDVRVIAAAQAIARNDLDGLLRHWNVALTRRHMLRTTLFPDLLRLVENPANRPAFATLLERPVDWWPGFVAFVADQAASADVVGAVLRMGMSSPVNPLSGRALDPVLARFQRDSLWLEARLAWMDSLTTDQLNGMGNVFNGGFEAPISDTGFDWRRSHTEHVVIDTAPTAGAGGNLALNVLFRGPRVRFQHLQQLLALPPGGFVLRGRVRTDDLVTGKGLIWSLTCVGSRERQLAATAPELGRRPWHRFEALFSIPESGCPTQRLRLQLDGRIALDFDARGQAWYDDIEIVPAKIDGIGNKHADHH